MSFGTRHVPDAAFHFKGSITNLLWQKERLINLVAERLDRSYDAIAYIDRDFLFLNPTWLEDTRSLLANAPVVQLFSGLIYLDAKYSFKERCESGAQTYLRDNKTNGVPGGAWAIYRELFPIIDYYPLGGNDSLQYFSWIPAPATELEKILPRHILHRFSADRQKGCERVGGRVACVTGDVIHLFHASKRNRRYAERSVPLRQCDFDPASDIAIDDNGLWRWTGTKPPLQQAVRDYFDERREDSCEEREEPEPSASAQQPHQPDASAERVIQKICELEAAVQWNKSRLHHLQQTRSWRYTAWLRATDKRIASLRRNNVSRAIFRQTKRLWIAVGAPCPRAARFLRHHVFGRICPATASQDGDVRASAPSCE